MTGRADELDLARARSFLAGRGWLAEVPGPARERLLHEARLLPPLARGDLVYWLREPADGLYAVLSGCVAFEVAPHEDGPQLVHLFLPGAWFGELAYCLGESRIGAARATRATCCLQIPGRSLNALLREEPELWRWLARSLAHYAVLAVSALEDATLRSPRRRLAAVLLRLAGARPGDAATTPVELDLTQADLARLANLSRTAVSDNLSALAAEGLLQCRYGRVTLCDPQRLSYWLASEASHDEP